MIYVIMFIIGSCIGSFVNVIFTRRDWYKGRSRCDKCGYVLKWYDLIPILSYAALRGKCRNCREKIDTSHLVSEVIMGAAFCACSFCICTDGNLSAFIECIALICLAVAAIEDYKEQMVYSWILNSGIALMFIIYFGFGLIFGVISEMVFALLFVVFLKIVFGFIAKKTNDKIGAGDFDAFIMLMLIFGIRGFMLTLIYSCIIGCVIYLPPIIIKKRDKRAPLPFIPLLLFGTIANIIIPGVW